MTDNAGSIVGVITGDIECLAVMICASCDERFVSSTLIGCVEDDIPEVCPVCLSYAESITGEENLTKLLAEGELEFYFDTIREINNAEVVVWQ
jgi:hypothetical protein